MAKDYTEIDAEILEAISSFDGVPTAHSLSTDEGGPINHSTTFIRSRLKKNPALQKALEARGIAFVQSLDRQTFDKLLPLWRRLPLKVKQVVDQKQDQYILEAIQSANGVPTTYSLSTYNGGPTNYSITSIKSRLKKNPALQKALEARGIAFVQTCDRQTFDSSLTSGKWRNLPEKLREIMNQRLDRYILEAIRSSDGVPTASSLSKERGGPLEYSHNVIQARLYSNPDIRKELYLKQGLSEDQINALEVERDIPSSALRESIRRRLPNTRVFREALGVLQHFQNYLGNLLEISYYPQPLLRAAEMLRVKLDANYVRGQELKDPDFRLTERFDSIAMVQCCHRISNSALVRAFNEASKILPERGALLISVPECYKRTPVFETQVQDFGFEIQVEGTLFTKTLGIAELTAIGVEDPRRVKQKIEQATNILILLKTREAAGERLDDFVKDERFGGVGEYRPSLGEINTPEELLNGLSSVFQKKVVGLGGGFILTLLDDTGKERDLIGFDTHPSEPRTTELSSAYNSAMSLAELSILARRLTKSSFREKILVRPGRETKIPAKLVRNALRE